jgi:hypothetical protein
MVTLNLCNLTQTFNHTCRQQQCAAHDNLSLHPPVAAEKSCCTGAHALA